MLDWFRPNKKIPYQSYAMLITLEIVAVLLLWTFGAGDLIPPPSRIPAAFMAMVKIGFLGDVMSSMSMCLEAMFFTIIISLLITYSSVMKFFQPIAFMVMKMRFLTLVGLTFVFSLVSHDGGVIKLEMLTFGMTVFFVTSLYDILDGIPKNAYNHARTLGMGEWRVVLEVKVLGNFDQVFIVIRQIFSMSWMMVTMVEGVCRSQGGVGTMLLDQNKYLRLDAVFAIQFTVLVLGMVQDYLFGAAKNFFCPWSNLSMEKK